MKYSLTLRSIAVETESIEAKHERLMAAMFSVGGGWGLRGDMPTAPDAGKELLAECRLNANLPSGVRGSVAYRFRRGLGSQAMDDDHLSLSFDPSRHDIHELVEHALPQHLRGFGAYRLDGGPAALAELDASAARRVDKRRGVFRIWPISFYVDDLCRRAFNVSAEDFVALVADACAHASVVEGGALIAASYGPFSLDQCVAFDATARNRLSVALPAI